MSIFTKAFWVYAGERAIKTVAQTAVAALTVGGVTGVLDVAWIPLASGVALAGIISVLTSLVAYTPDPVIGVDTGAPTVPVEPTVPAGE